MRSILKKLHFVPGESEDLADCPSSNPLSKGGGHHHADQQQKPEQQQKALSGLSNWLNSVTSRHSSSPSSSNPSPSSSSSSSASIAGGSGGENREQQKGSMGGNSGSSVGTPASASDEIAKREASAEMMDEEEYQIQLALELSAREDPEAVQIEAVKQISLGAFPPDNSPAELISYRYWNYNTLDYDDKILDGFYDIYGILVESSLVKMPSLVDLQGTPVSDSLSWEAVLVNRAEDADLLKLEQKALVMALEARSESLDFAGSGLVQRLAVLVANYMGGAVCDPESMLKAWRNVSNHLRASVGNMVLPLGRITFGLARHRALLFKDLAYTLGIPCRLVKGQEYTGSDDGALNIVKLKDGREYIVDLMADPGTLIPSDGTGPAREFQEIVSVVNPFFKDVDNFDKVSPDCGVSSSPCPYSEIEPLGKISLSSTLDPSDSGSVALPQLRNPGNKNLNSTHKSSTEGFINEKVQILDDSTNTSKAEMAKSREQFDGTNHSYTITRSPSWTEGINSPSVSRMKVNDVSQYMINAAKDNPQLAQKLHDVLLESGVVAPPNLFTEISTERPEPVMIAAMHLSEDKSHMKKWNEFRKKTQGDGSHGPVLPCLPTQDVQQKVVPSRSQLQPLKPVEGLGVHPPLDFRDAAIVPCSSQTEAFAAQSLDPLQFLKHMPVAAAAATAAVVASSMVVAAAKSNTDMNLEVPVAAAATATAAAVVATTAAVNKQYEQLESRAAVPGISGADNNSSQTSGDEVINNVQVGSDHGHAGSLEQEQDTNEAHQVMDRTSDRSTGTESASSDVTIDDVAELEIPWEDIILGERIGLGSFGEVYHGDWHGTEVAVKKFLHQDLSGDALEEFRSEVRIMRRLRHPNVVLLMGAVTRVPNLSIITEFLPRGSLYRLIHRPNNQLDERRRLKMALDIARGMNYLHNCTPVIVHRDLKSPNLLVDKNWVVKVCDFGLSRMKHNTFLSSRSTAGTAEWMAPEVLRNEPSDEKCDVFSFGVILWELCTLQQPWGGLNAMQVVGAVGFQHRRLDIPDDTNPVISDIIKKCWQTEAKMRPSFSEIMAALKPLQKPVSATQVPRQRARVAEGMS